MIGTAAQLAQPDLVDKRIDPAAIADTYWHLHSQVGHSYVGAFSPCGLFVDDQLHSHLASPCRMTHSSIAAQGVDDAAGLQSVTPDVIPT